MNDKLSSLMHDKSFLRREQTRMLCESIPRGNVFSLLLATVLALFIYKETSIPVLVIWLAGVIVAVIARYIVHIEYQSCANKIHHPHKWYLIFIFLCASPMALAWGLAGILFYPTLNSLEQTALLIMLVAFSASSMPSLSIRTNTYAIHLLLVYSPLVTYLLVQGHTGEKMLSLMLIIIASTKMVAGKRFYSLFVSNIFYQAETQRLLDDLKRTNSHLSIANENLQQLSITDDMTNIANRRYFNQRFLEIWSDHIREENPLSALMVDVDFFKSFNDSYGHQAGDQCLKEIAGALRTALYRPRDFLARYGGEEFVVLLPNTSEQGALEIATRLHEQIKESNIEHKGKGIDNRLTISIGITTIQPPTSLTREKFIQQADKALYTAKAQGRNQSYFLPS